MAIIGVSGYSGSGKDTVGKIVKELEPEKFWQIKKFAGKLKDVATLLTGIPTSMFEDQEFKKTVLPHEWWTTCDEGHIPMTIREFLQKLGTDGLRNNLHTNVWVNALMADYKPKEMYVVNKKSGELELVQNKELPNWIITDVRFPNEAKAIKEKGGILIRIDRPGNKAVNQHPSETSLDNWDFDYKIGNVSDLVSLGFTVSRIVELINIAKEDEKG